jgi:hypothetical protein
VLKRKNKEKEGEKIRSPLFLSGWAGDNKKVGPEFRAGGEAGII